MAEPQNPNHLPGPHPHYYDVVMHGVMKPLLAMYGGVEHRGAEVLSEIEGPVIVAPRHQSMLDVPAVAQAALEGADEHVHFMAKQELWKVPGLGKLIEWGGGFPIDRDTGTLPLETQEHLEGLVTQDALIGIFPEGMRRSGDTIGHKDIRAAVPRLATTYGITIVPVGVAGTEKGNRAPIKVVFGEPIAPEAAHTRRPNILRRALATSIQALQDEAASWSRYSVIDARHSRKP